jgi:hypothetical protein
MWDAVSPYLLALLPTVAVGTLFYFLIKTILEGDRRERLAQSRWEKEQERAQGPDFEPNSQNGEK